MSFTILECRRFLAQCTTPVTRRINHYEMDFYIGGTRKTLVDGKEYRIEDGTMCFRRPGQTVTSVGDYNCFVSTLTFSDTPITENFHRNRPDTKEESVSYPLIDSIPDVFIPYHKSEILSCFAFISGLQSPRCEEGVNAMTELLHLVNADLCRLKLQGFTRSVSPADTVQQYISMHYGEEITLPGLASLVSLDKSYLIRLFRRKFGMSPIEYLIDCRLTQARAFLTNTDMTVNEICAACGYNSPSFFISQYRERFGCTPGEFRTRMRPQGQSTD